LRSAEIEATRSRPVTTESITGPAMLNPSRHEVGF
jgi:hypothetical protein